MSVFNISTIASQLPDIRTLLGMDQQRPRNLSMQPDVLGSLLGGNIPDDNGAQAGAVAPTQASTFGQQLDRQRDPREAVMRSQREAIMRSLLGLP